MPSKELREREREREGRAGSESVLSARFEEQEEDDIL